MVRSAPLPVLLALVGWAGCGNGPELQVIVEAESEVAARARRLEADANGSVMATADVTGVQFPLRFSVVPEGPTDRALTLRARLLGDLGLLGEQRLELPGVGESGFVRLCFDDACIDTVCSGGQSCRQGLCLSDAPSVRRSEGAAQCAELAPGASEERATGALSLYTFDEGEAGRIVDQGRGFDQDRAGLVDLDIPDLGAVRRERLGLRITGDVRIAPARASRVHRDALVASPAGKLEAWVRPDPRVQGGPARIHTLEGA
ncbi:MAG: hypothetical protein AAF411_19935, partial [Myxococcota bacterium]